jgi:hypothetical protein
MHRSLKQTCTSVDSDSTRTALPISLYCNHPVTQCCI